MNKQTDAIWRRVSLMALALAPVLTGVVQAAEMPAGTVELDETVISGNQELPKVLYIVPWQQPDGLPEIELRTEFAEGELFRRLYPPAYRRELAYFEASEAGAATADSRSSDSKE